MKSFLISILSPREAQEETLQENLGDRIISHGINGDKEDPSAKNEERNYCVRWYGLDRSDDTFESILHLPRTKTSSLYMRIKQPLLNIEDEALQG